MSTTYRSTTDEAATLRQELKAHGWNSRQISVRAEYFSMGSSIHVVIKAGSISLPVVKALAEGKERIHRCEMTGEILGGANRYVHVRLTDEARAVKARRVIDAVESAIAKLDPASPNMLQQIGDTDYCVGRDRSGLTLWGESSHIAGYMVNADDVAGRLAVAQEQQEYEKSVR